MEAGLDLRGDSISAAAGFLFRRPTGLWISDHSPIVVELCTERCCQKLTEPRSQYARRNGYVNHPPRVAIGCDGMQLGLKAGDIGGACEDRQVRILSDNHARGRIHEK